MALVYDVTLTCLSPLWAPWWWGSCPVHLSIIRAQHVPDTQWVHGAYLLNVKGLKATGPQLGHRTDQAVQPLHLMAFRPSRRTVAERKWSWWLHQSCLQPRSQKKELDGGVREQRTLGVPIDYQCSVGHCQFAWLKVTTPSLWFLTACSRVTPTLFKNRKKLPIHFREPCRNKTWVHFHTVPLVSPFCLCPSRILQSWDCLNKWSPEGPGNSQASTPRFTFLGQTLRLLIRPEVNR